MTSNRKDPGIQPGNRASASRLAAVFILLCGVLAFVLLLSRNEASPEGAGKPNGGAESVKATLVERFRQIDELRIEALERRDASVLEGSLTADSPMRERISRTIDRLSKQKVLVDELSQLEEISILRVDAAQAIVRIVVLDDRMFVSEDGEPVEASGQRERQTAECDLQEVGGVWMLHECTIKATASV